MIETRCINTLDNTEYKHLSYRFYIYILVLVVCNCLLFHCGCVGFCYCCGGKVDSVSKNDIITIRKVNGIEIKYVKNSGKESISLTQTVDGIVDGKQIVGCNFANEREVYYVPYEEKSHKEFIKDLRKKEKGKSMYVESGFWRWVFSGKQIIKAIDTYLFALVTVKGDKYLIYCPDANSIKSFFGLFEASSYTKIEILSCGSKIKDICSMFWECRSLQVLDLSNFNTNSVKNMRNMFGYCFKNGATLICKKSEIYKLTNCLKYTDLHISDKLSLEGDDNTLYEFTIKRKNDSLSPTIKAVKVYNN